MLASLQLKMSSVMSMLFIKKEFTTQVMFYAPLVMWDDGPDVSNDEFEKMSNFVKS